MKTPSLRRAIFGGFIATLLALSFATVNAQTNGSWTNVSGTWSTAGNWLGGQNIADGAGATANFQVSLTASRTVTLDTNRTVGILQLGNGSNSRGFTFNPSSNQILTLDGNGSNAQIQFASGGGNANINVPVALNSNLLITNSDSGGNKGFFFSAGLSSTNGNLTVTNTSNAASRTKFNSPISDGTGTITFNQTNGWSEFNAANTFTGSTTNGGGTLILGNSLALQNSTLDTTGSIAGTASVGLRVATGVTTLTLGGLTGNKNFAATGGVFNTTAATSLYGNVTALTLNPGIAAAPSYSGVIANGAANMSLTKSGAGTQTLSGANTYTGNTTVHAGTLKLDINGSFNNSLNIIVGDVGSTGTHLDVTTATSGLTIGLAQTLKGIGQIDGDTTILGTHAPGNSPGLQTFNGNLAYSTGSMLNWELTSNVSTDIGAIRGVFFDGVDVIGTGSTLSVAAGVTSNLIFNGAGSSVDFGNSFWTSNHSWQVYSDANAPTLSSAAIFGPINVSADSLAATLSAGSFSWSQVGNDVFLNFTVAAVPEPAGVAVGLLCMGAAAFRRRRRD